MIKILTAETLYYLLDIYNKILEEGGTLNIWNNATITPQIIPQRCTIDAISKITTKIIDGFRRKKKTEAIFFDIEKMYDKVNRAKILEKLKNMGMQERMMEFIRELIGERWIKVRVGEPISQSKQTDLGIP